MATRIRQSINATPAPSSRGRHTREATAVGETPRTATTSRRNRQTTAAPSTVPRSTAAATSTNASAANALPEYQLPTHALNEAGMERLAKLLQEHKVDKIDAALKTATNLLRDSAGDINERISDMQIRRAKRKQAQAEKERENENENQNQIEDENQDGDTPEDVKIRESKEKVDAMTNRMDDSLRKVIDGYAALDALDRAVTEVRKRAREAVAAETARKRRETEETAADEEATSTQAQTQRTTTTLGGLGMDEEGDDTTLQTPQATVSTRRTQSQTQTQRDSELPQLPDVFTNRVNNLMLTYTNRTLYQRYAGHNDYIAMKEAVHSAQADPTEKSTLPDPRTWFAAEEEPEPGVTQTGDAEEDDDDDIAVSRQTISTRCPLTLRDFETPVTSSKCHHSFEKFAILEMIHQQPRTAPAPRRRGVPAADIQIIQSVRCPVPGCQSTLMETDLREDAGLVRRIRRIQKARELAAEEGQSELGGGFAGAESRRTTGGVTEIESGDEDEDGMDIDDLERAEGLRGRTPAASSRVKAELASQSQRRRGRGVEDIEDD